MMNGLSERDLQRYDRQMLIHGWGKEGQLRLKNAKVTVAGTGGLGCPASMYLTVAGIGHIQLIDNDCFEFSNLNRQILCWENDVGRQKTVAVKEKLGAMNADIAIEAKQMKITASNVQDLIQGSDAVIDAMDNWETRFLLNRYCVKNGIPFVHAGIHGLSGQVTTIVPGKGPCLNCILLREPPEIKPFPVMGATPGLFAMIQVIEVVKLLLGIGKPLIGRLLLISGEEMSVNIVEISKNPQCPVCKEI